MASSRLKQSSDLGPDVSALIKEKLEEALRKRGRVNILIGGKTGVGKSTLINAIFQGDLATTGQGRPVTTHTREYRKDGVPVSIFDTRGLELEKFDETLNELISLIEKRGQSDDPNEHLHCAWICLSEDGRRVEDAEINLCRRLAALKLPVVAVITKARSDGGFRAKVQSLLPDAANVVRVRAIQEVLDDGPVLEPFGLVELVELTMELVPESQKNAFAAAQKVVLRQKQDRANILISGAVASATTIGAVPVPFSDAVLLIPVHITMLAGISSVFGLPLSTGFLSTVVSSTLAGAAGTLGGRALVSALLLLIPGAGPFLKGAVSGATAAAFTLAFGSAYVAALSALIERDPKNPPRAEDIAEQLKTEMAKRNPFGR